MVAHNNSEASKLPSILWSITDSARGKSEDPTLPVYLAYAALCEKGCAPTEKFEFEIIGDEAGKEATTYEKIVNELAMNYEAEDLKEFILTFDPAEHYGKFAGDHSTPLSLCLLANAVLGLKDGDSIADLGCGYGAFLVNAVRAAKPSRIFGIDTNPSSAQITSMKMALMGKDADIEFGDMLSMEGERKYNKVFSNFPFGMRTPFMGAKSDSLYYEILRSGGSMGRPSLADWVFNKVAFDILEEDGKAVTISASGAAFNGGDSKTRKYFVDNGMIQAVIALPERMFPTTSIKTTMVVLGRNDGGIRMVDATDLAIPGRRWNAFDEDSIAQVLERLESDSDQSRLVSKEEIAGTEYNLYPLRYLGRDLDLIDPVPFRDVIVSVERGATMRASELDKLETNEDTGYKYVKLADITDGRINGDLSNLVELDSSTKNQWLKTGDLVISKNGAPFKIAVAEIPEDITVLANGNLYIIRLNEELVNPYYVAAFLASNDGKEALSRMTVGTSIPNLPLRNLKDMQIPMLPRKQQDEIAERYQASLDEIEILKIKMEKARVNAGEAYDTVVERWRS